MKDNKLIAFVDLNHSDVTTKLGLNNVVHKTSDETITGKKTFNDEIGVTSSASIQYDSTNECIKFIFN